MFWIALYVTVGVFLSFFGLMNVKRSISFQTAFVVVSVFSVLWPLAALKGIADITEGVKESSL